VKTFVIGSLRDCPEPLKPTKIVIGNPMEFFREMELFFSETNLTISRNTSFPKLVPTGIDGVAHFEGELQTNPIKEYTSRMRHPSAGAFLMVCGMGGCAFYLLFYGFFSGWQSVLSLLSFALIAALILSAVYFLGSVKDQYSGILFLEIKG